MVTLGDESSQQQRTTMMMKQTEEKKDDKQTAAVKLSKCTHSRVWDSFTVYLQQTQYCAKCG